RLLLSSCFVFDISSPATSSTLSLHDALPISHRHGWRLTPDRLGRHGSRRTAGGFERATPLRGPCRHRRRRGVDRRAQRDRRDVRDRKSTRLNSSHVKISYAVFCLKKKRKIV